ncbi:MAG: hypothetical protein R3D68_16840 [Hyphomicrobiaceae bacterium]
MSMTRIAALSIALLAAPSGVVQAQEAWNPFAERDAARAAKRQQARAAPSDNSRLPSMDGADRRSWEPQQGGDPYGRSNGGGAQVPAPYGPQGAAPYATSAPRVSDTIEREALPVLDGGARGGDRVDARPMGPVGRPVGRGAGMSGAWGNIGVKEAMALVSHAGIPPQSMALSRLWRRLWSADAAPGGPGGGNGDFAALRLEALFRTGALADATAILADRAVGEGPKQKAFKARYAIALGQTKDACADIRTLLRSLPSKGDPARTELLLLSGYCAAVDGKREATELAADLARAEGVSDSVPLAALTSIAIGAPQRVPSEGRLTLLDYRFMQVAKLPFPKNILERAEPGLLTAIAADTAAPAHVRIAAAEMAAKRWAIDATALAEAYRGAGDAVRGAGNDGLQRAGLFVALEAERTPMRRTRTARALLDAGHHAGLGLQVAAVVGHAIADLAPVQEISWFAESAIEALVASGDYGRARDWADLVSRDRSADIEHWLVLIDIADPAWPGPRGTGFAAAERLAVQGQWKGDDLNRLATALDALNYQIPIPLWEAASRSPQPTAGHLPETGVLSALQAAAKAKDVARTALLAMRAIGPNGVAGAHMIALGDAIRALRQVGLEGDARRLAMEATFAAWPRMVRR